MTAGARKSGPAGPFMVDNDIRHRSHIEGYEPEIDGVLRARIALGVELSDAERAALPTRISVGCKPTKTLTFIYAMNAGPFIFPPSAHRALMELEPEGHLFHEVEAVVGSVSLGPYFLQLQSPIVDCVDLDATIWRERRRRDYYDEMMAREKGPHCGPPYVSLSGAQHVAVHEASIAGRHWWRAPERFAREHFCSRALRDGFKLAGVAGVRYTPCEATGRALPA